MEYVGDWRNMSGAIMAVAGAAAASSRNYSVTVAIPVAGFTGYIDGSGGAITPAAIKGVNIDAAGTTFSGALSDFELSLDGGGVLPQNFIRAVMVQRTNGTWVQYNTATAKSFSAGATTWIWGSGADPAWTVAPATRSLIIFV